MFPVTLVMLGKGIIGWSGNMCEILMLTFTEVVYCEEEGNLSVISVLVYWYDIA